MIDLHEGLNEVAMAIAALGACAQEKPVDCAPGGAGYGSPTAPAIK